MENIHINGLSGMANHGDLNIIMEVIRVDVDLPTIIEILEGGVVVGDDEIGKELKDQFIMVGMIEVNERKGCGMGKRLRTR